MRWWEPVAHGLETSGRVVVLDFPRRLHPEGLTGWVADAIEPLAPVDLAGHSLGALIAVRVAVSRPELVRRLILVAPPGIRPWPTPLHLARPLVATLARTRLASSSRSRETSFAPVHGTSCAVGFTLPRRT